jgi:signal transduction histidine kinase
MTLALAAGVLERQETEERLRRAEAELLQAEARKVAERDEFLGIAAHELRTPLTSLQLAVEILQREAASPDGARRSLQVVGSQTARLGQLVGQLLDTVRIETGRFALEVAEVDVSALARGAVAEAQAGTDRHEIVLRAPAELRASVDALRLEQVLRNLLDNAVKFSQGGRVDVDLATADGRFRISIRDHGQGVPAVHRAGIFERSYQGPVDPRSGGLGLGLHVSRHIVELHGGNIEAEFPHDGGTRIVVDLPLGGERKDMA